MLRKKSVALAPDGCSTRSCEGLQKGQFAVERVGKLPWEHRLGNDALDVGGTLCGIVIRCCFQKTVDDGADEHGPFEFDAGGLANFQADLVQGVNLPRR